MSTAAHTDVTPRATQGAPIRIGAVSFVNTLPLIDGLEGLSNLTICRSVPSLLLDQLLAGEVDVALCSSIDYQRAPEPLLIVPSGMLACAGPTLTVRLYAQQPIERLQRVYCDTDSHTSVALLTILLEEQFGIRPELIDYDAREHVAENRPIDWPEAVLLIGDKVVTDSPPAVRYPHQLDLGAAWHDRTGLPFVFATWMALGTADRDRLAVAAAILDRQRRHNIHRLDRIIHERARPRDWPVDLAATYLKQRLVYEMTEEHCRAMELFFSKSHELGLIERVRSLDLLV